MVSSSPVKNTATRSLRHTGSSARPTDAASPSSWLRRRVPAGKITLPSLMSSPARRIHSPGLGAWRTVTTPSTSSHCSCMTTASAPGGISAPVKMRAAVPGCKGWPTWPAGMRCDTGSAAEAPTQSAARTA